MSVVLLTTVNNAKLSYPLYAPICNAFQDEQLMLSRMPLLVKYEACLVQALIRAVLTYHTRA